MSMFKSYWTVQGISLNARNTAIRAAEAEGEELGVWLSRLINKVCEEEGGVDATADDMDTSSNDNEENPDDKLSSIERAMKQAQAAGEIESA